MRSFFRVKKDISEVRMKNILKKSIAFVMAMSMTAVISASIASAQDPKVEYPFVLSEGEVSAFTEDGYTYTDYDSADNWKPFTNTADLYTVTLPKDSENVTLTFSQAAIAYGYDSDGAYKYSCSADKTNGYAGGGSVGELTANIYDTDCIVRVQTPYDAYVSELLYAVKFVIESDENEDKEYAGATDVDVDASLLEGDTEEIFKKLYESLSAGMQGSSDWLALAAAAQGKASLADKEKVTEDAIAAGKNPYGTNTQSSAIICAALGIDVTSLDGGSVNLPEILASDFAAIGSWAESPAYTLLAYAANASYGIAADAQNAPSKLIKLLKDNYMCTDGGYGWNGLSSPDTTGAVLAALSCYKDYDGVDEMIDKAVNALYMMQNADGGFGYSAGTETNIDSTSLAIIGLCSVGIDPASEEWTTTRGGNPITALLMFANDDASDIVVPEGTSISYARSDALRALTAYSGLRNTKAAYNIYTMAAKGNAGYISPDSPAESEPENESTEPSDKGTSGISGNDNAGRSSVNTADTANAWMWVIFGIVCAAACAACILRKNYSERKGR